MSHENPRRYADPLRAPVARCSSTNSRDRNGGRLSSCSSTSSTNSSVSSRTLMRPCRSIARGSLLPVIDRAKRSRRSSGGACLSLSVVTSRIKATRSRVRACRPSMAAVSKSAPPARPRHRSRSGEPNLHALILEAIVLRKLLWQSCDLQLKFGAIMRDDDGASFAPAGQRLSRLGPGGASVSDRTGGRAR